MSQRSETEEWLDELAASWVEVYKKSMTTLLLLRIVDASAPTGADSITEAFTEQTGWQITERGLYRTLRRLAASGLLTTEEQAVPRTGRKRKLFSLTDHGRAYLARLSAEELPRS